MKIAPVMEALKKHTDFELLLVHTGQHYDDNLSKVFFEELGIPKPDINLGVGSGSHAWQAAEVMKKIEEIFIDRIPDLVIVVGDVNSTISCALTAKKLHIDVAHIEAGLRSHDRKMPEELNRIVVDHLSDYLFITSKKAGLNLFFEGIHGRNKVFFVGNVLIDTLLKNREKAEKSEILRTLNLEKQKYAVLTLHREGNVDLLDSLQKMTSILNAVQKKIDIVCPIHPRTMKKFKRNSIDVDFRLIYPLGYLDFINLMSNSKFVMTDSGGIQEETTVLGIPCLTLRDNTERPVTVTDGTNIVTFLDEKNILSNVDDILNGKFKTGKIPEKWDGKASERIAKILWDIYE